MLSPLCPSYMQDTQMAHKGRSVLPIQNRYLVPSCAHCPKICNLCTKPLFCYHLSQKLCPTLPESVSEQFVRSYTNYGCSKLFGNLKRQERQVAETAPRCHRVTHRAGHQQVTQMLSHIHYPTDTRQLTSPQGEADVRSLEGI